MQKGRYLPGGSGVKGPAAPWVVVVSAHDLGERGERAEAVRRGAVNRSLLAGPTVGVELVAGLLGDDLPSRVAEHVVPRLEDGELILDAQARRQSRRPCE